MRGGPPRCRRLLASIALLALSLQASPAAAGPQWSARFGQGGGSRTWDPEFLWELQLRSELLFGAPGDEHLRIGPALELRSVDVETFEVGAGLALLLPVVRGFPIVLSALGGYGWRSEPDASGLFLVTTLAWGYRSYDWHGSYALALQPYLSGRMRLDDPRHWEITLGVELDLEGILLIPILALRMLLSGDDPDEPSEPLEPLEPLEPVEPRAQGR
ncbi:MAG: hypothetical protein OEY14_01915 [Myxococcales bacterium]|nr:hypothetical protein [Myxococcales bacterium]